MVLVLRRYDDDDANDFGKAKTSSNRFRYFCRLLLKIHISIPISEYMYTFASAVLDQTSRRSIGTHTSLSTCRKCPSTCYVRLLSSRD